jgi:hypothetical protein
MYVVSNYIYDGSQKNHIYDGRVDLAQLIRFLMVELTHSILNPKFNMGVVFMANYSFQ